MKFSNRDTKKCPRCGTKCLINQQTCPECGLIFARLEFASNKAAKKKILRFDRDFVIYTNQYPKDISWIKLLLYSIFLGLFGGHYYYCGKYIKGSLMTASFVYLMFCTIFNDQMYALMENQYFYLPIGIAAFAWIYSMLMVITKRFKVPVIVDMPKPQISGTEEKK